MSIVLSRLLSRPSLKVHDPFTGLSLIIQFVLLGAVGVVLVSVTTSVVGREWGYHENHKPVPPVVEQPGYIDEGGEEKEEENPDEGVNVLHLLYTIAQVPCLFGPEFIAGSSAPGRVCAQRNLVQ